MTKVELQVDNNENKPMAAFFTDKYFANWSYITAISLNNNCIAFLDCL